MNFTVLTYYLITGIDCDNHTSDQQITTTESLELESASNSSSIENGALYVSALLELNFKG